MWGLEPGDGCGANRSSIAPAELKWLGCWGCLVSVKMKRNLDRCFIIWNDNIIEFPEDAYKQDLYPFFGEVDFAKSVFIYWAATKQD